MNNLIQQVAINCIMGQDEKSDQEEEVLAYILGFLCIGLQIIFCYFAGSINTQNRDISYRIVRGYVLISFLLALGGIFVGVLKLRWIIFAVYLLLVYLGIFFYWGWKTIHGEQKHIYGEKTHVHSLKQYLMERYVLVVVIVFMAFMTIFYFRSYWFGGFMDDGYYVTKVAVLPMLEQVNHMEYSVGTIANYSAYYLITTIELESSVYAYFFRIDATLYLRFFQAVLHYTLFVNCAYVFIKKIILHVKPNTDQKKIQWVTVVLILFCSYFVFLEDSSLLPIIDTWHFNTAMYYGSSVVTMMAFMLLSFPYFEEAKGGHIIRLLVEEFVIAVMLMSRSSIALPIILVGNFVLILVFVCDQIKFGKYLLIGGSIIWLCVSAVVGNKGPTEKYLWADGLEVFKSPVLWICIILVAISFFLKNKVIHQISISMILFVALIMVPLFNNGIEFVSVYTFVEARMWSAFIYTLVIICGAYLYLILGKLFNKEVLIPWVYMIIGTACMGLAIWSTGQYGGELYVTKKPAETNLVEDAKVIYHNRKFVSNSLIDVGNDLERLYKDKGEQLYVVSPMIIAADGGSLSLAVQLRTFASDVISVSAVQRYTSIQDENLAGYENEKFETFVGNPGKDTLNELDHYLKKYPVNCLIVPSKECGVWLEQIGYHYYAGTTTNMYIYYR